jgi:methylenetetrahydrofolate reductase (NADPH)
MLRDQGHFLSGRKLDLPPKFFLGAASNPFIPPYDFRPLRMAKKIEAGAEFFQTQYCFDFGRLCQFMNAVRDLGLHERAYILVGVGPLRSAKAAEWTRTHVPGVVIPDEVIRRLQGAAPGKQREEGKRICIEMIQQVREVKGVSGVHVMAYRQEELVAEIIEEAGLLPRRWRDELGQINPCEEVPT